MPVRSALTADSAAAGSSVAGAAASGTTAINAAITSVCSSASAPSGVPGACWGGRVRLQPGSKCLRLSMHCRSAVQSPVDRHRRCDAERVRPAGRPGLLHLDKCHLLGACRRSPPPEPIAAWPMQQREEETGRAQQRAHAVDRVGPSRRCKRARLGQMGESLLEHRSLTGNRARLSVGERGQGKRHQRQGASPRRSSAGK
jgi:hypothetical protein